MAVAKKKAKSPVKKKAPVGNTGGGGLSFENTVAARFMLDLESPCDGTTRTFVRTADVVVLGTGQGTHAAEAPWNRLLREILEGSCVKP